jgi:hypothetical protein
MIVLDNSERYPGTTAALRAGGFFQMDFSGFGPINAYAWTTSLFMRAEQRLQQGFTPPRPIGGMAFHQDEDA